MAQDIKHSPNLQLHLLLKHSAEKWPDNCALDFYAKRLSYRELYQQAKYFAAALEKIGIKKGDVLAIMMPNCLYYAVCFHGALMAGVIITNISPLSAPMQIKQMLKKTQPKAFVSVDVKLIFDKIKPLIDEMNFKQNNEIPSLKYFIIGKFTENLPFAKKILAKIFKRAKFAPITTKLPNLLSLEKLMTEKLPFDVTKIKQKDDDIALLQFTGGTTGTQKAAILTKANIAVNIKQILLQELNIIEGEEVFLGALPFFHIFSLVVNLLLPLRIGASVTVITNMDCKQIIKQCKRTRCTIFAAVPSLYATLNLKSATAKSSLKQVKYFVSGGAALENHVQKRFKRNFNKDIYQGYGLTEAPVVALNPLNQDPVENKMKPLHDTKIKIVSLKDAKIEVETGELIIRAPQVMQGYWQDEEESSHVLRDGWLHTGDIATRYKNGYLRIVGRSKDIIITGGYNVYPGNVESAIYEFGGIEEVLVLGLSDKLRGQSVFAYIFSPDNFVDEEKLRNFLKQHLTDYEVPRKFIFSPLRLPRTAVGKLSRHMLLKKIKDED